MSHTFFPRHAIYDLEPAVCDSTRVQALSKHVSLMTKFPLRSFSMPFNVDSQKNHLQHIMLQWFKKGSSVKDTTDENCIAYGTGTTTIRTVRNWFKKFRADVERNGPSAATDTDVINSAMVENLRYSVREIVEATNIPRKSVHNPSIKLEYVNR